MFKKQLDIENKQISYVGDTNTDRMTAQNANVTSVGVTWGFWSRDELVENKVTFIIDDAYELLKICKIKGEDING